MPSHYTIGIDWGKKDPEAVYWRLDVDTQQYVPITKEQYQELERTDRKRQRWGRQLMIDYKAGTTKGAYQRHWRKAQLYFQLGKI